MKTAEELIKSIDINRGNFEHIGETGRMSGTLYTEIKRVMEQYAKDRIIDNEETNLIDFANWFNAQHGKIVIFSSNIEKYQSEKHGQLYDQFKQK